MVIDADGRYVPNATITLYFEGEVFDVPGNPQQSNAVADPHKPIGRYQFMRLPRGEYLIIAEIPDAAGTLHQSSLSVNVTANTTTADIVIPDLVPSGPAMPSPAASPSATEPPISVSICSSALVLPLLGMGAVLVAQRKTR